MPWRFTEDVEEYVEKVWDLLAADPVRNTVALTVIASVRAGRRWSDEPMLFGWHDGPPADGAVLMTPPWPLQLTIVPEHGVGELVTELRAYGAQLPGVNGEVGVVDRFVAAWKAVTGVTAQTAMSQRLYALRELRPPSDPVGRSRTAVESDVDVAVEFAEAFQVEARIPAVEVATGVRLALADGRLQLWEDPNGTVVSMAGRNPTAAGVARVGPVYTPPQHRRHGYGTAVTAAGTEAALHGGADDVVLFTDLANPTSNAIYQQIGFEPICDHAVVDFTDGPTG